MIQLIHHEIPKETVDIYKTLLEDLNKKGCLPSNTTPDKIIDSFIKCNWIKFWRGNGIFNLRNYPILRNKINIDEVVIDTYKIIMPLSHLIKNTNITIEEYEDEITSSKNSHKFKLTHYISILLQVFDFNILLVSGLIGSQSDMIDRIIIEEYDLNQKNFNDNNKEEN